MSSEAYGGENYYVYVRSPSTIVEILNDDSIRIYRNQYDECIEHVLDKLKELRNRLKPRDAYGIWAVTNALNFTTVLTLPHSIIKDVREFTHVSEDGHSTIVLLHPNYNAYDEDVRGNIHGAHFLKPCDMDKLITHMELYVLYNL